MPSGHTSLITWWTLHFCYYLTSRLDIKKQCVKIAIWIFGFATIGSVGFSRIYLAAHTYNQVVIGAATAFFIWALETYLITAMEEGFLPNIINKAGSWREHSARANRLLSAIFLTLIIEILICKWIIERIFKKNNCDVLDKFGDPYPDLVIRSMVTMT